MLKRVERNQPIPEKRPSKLRRKENQEEKTVESKDKEEMNVTEEVVVVKEVPNLEICQLASVSQGKSRTSHVYYYFTESKTEKETYICQLAPEVLTRGSNRHSKYVRVSSISPASNLRVHLQTWHNKNYLKILDGRDFFQTKLKLNFLLGEKSGASGQYIAKGILANDSSKKQNAISSFFRSLPEKESKLRKELKLVIWMINSNISFHSIEVFHFELILSL